MRLKVHVRRRARALLPCESEVRLHWGRYPDDGLIRLSAVVGRSPGSHTGYWRMRGYEPAWGHSLRVGQAIVARSLTLHFGGKRCR